MHALKSENMNLQEQTMLNMRIVGFYCGVGEVMYPFFTDGILRQFFLDLSTIEDEATTNFGNKIPSDSVSRIRRTNTLVLNIFFLRNWLQWREGIWHLYFKTFCYCFEFYIT
jgi:hypothetical protein